MPAEKKNRKTGNRAEAAEGPIPEKGRGLYLLRYSEIALKGKNRILFEKRLMDNLRVFLKAEGYRAKVRRLHSRILVELEGGSSGRNPCFQRVFGVSSWSPVILARSGLEEIGSKALSLLENSAKTTTFRVSARRLTKDFPLTSPEIDRQLGALIVKTKGWKVKLEGPELDLGLEVDGPTTYLFTETVKCFAGLPVGVEGNVLARISEDEKSHLAALLLAKRGCGVVPFAVGKPDSPALSLLSAFLPYMPPSKVIDDLEELGVLAEKHGCKALVVEDTLFSLRDYSVGLPILRPLIGLSDDEIAAELEKYKSAL